MGEARLSRWLRQRRVRGYADVAARAVAAAQTQHTVLAGQDVAASIVAELATTILTQHERLRLLDQQIQDTFARHPQAEVIESIPGFGPILGASLLVAAGDLAAFPIPGHLAAAAGLVPVPNDSGRRAGNLHKPRRYSRPLRHALYLSVQTSMMRAGPNRDYYLKKRDQGRTHSQAVIALARRRIDVLWALLRDNRTWTAAACEGSGRLATPLRFPVPWLAATGPRPRRVVRRSSSSLRCRHLTTPQVLRRWMESARHEMDPPRDGTASWWSWAVAGCGPITGISPDGYKRDEVWAAAESIERLSSQNRPTVPAPQCDDRRRARPPPARDDGRRVRRPQATQRRRRLP